MCNGARAATLTVCNTSYVGCGRVSRGEGAKLRITALPGILPSRRLMSSVKGD
jgi:hypothetical protein